MYIETYRNPMNKENEIDVEKNIIQVLCIYVFIS